MHVLKGPKLEIFVPEFLHSLDYFTFYRQNCFIGMPAFTFFSDVGDSVEKNKIAIFKPKPSKLWIFLPSF